MYFVGLIDGSTEVWQYNFGAPSTQVLRFQVHSGSVRGVSLSDDGHMLYSISADRSIKGINTTGALAVNYENAHRKAINQLFFLSPTEFATGDDDGVVKLWDVRTPHAVMEYELHEDFISSFAYNPDRSTLLSTAGDASMCAYDLRNQANTARSDEQESEIHCLQIIKDGKKVPEGFVYSSDNNTEWISDADLQAWIDDHREKIGSI